ncbi:LacI family DNA-binding transcriptional regulator [Rhizobium sp. BK251]|uniref:LacI family DNA-binding transcriptional regulator n=1 Tax=Rhizobium sp. BK251 TaxID=2512125 RepID=UPI0010F361FF|nr:LacI family DNA-binding transcriptional regulator [Rhizobium sp. BK251]TCL68128.1 DNA-binding LacI/PurR family transcriptional regulator [Rhizobium sp. BK251]
MTNGKSKGPGSVTSRDVAKAAKVSQALVSRAFTGHGRIAPETRERILKVADDIGWQPNALARSMVTGDAPLVAVITTRLHFDWRAQVLSHLLKAVQEWHLKPLLFYAESDDQVDRLLEESIGWRTRGVIVTAGNVQTKRAEAILSGGRFFAALNRPANHPGAFSIATDNTRGGATAASLLLAEGRRRFLVISGPQDSWAPSLRANGFMAAIRAQGEAVTVWHNETMTIEAGKDCASAFLALPAGARPDAVFATNDALALGFMDGLRGKVSIPDDLSLIGFDNLPASSWTPYQLTTFEQPLDEMVSRIVDYVNLHQQLDGRHDPTRTSDNGLVHCSPKIILRSTTKADQ